MLTHRSRASFSLSTVVKTLVLALLIAIPAIANQDPRIAEGTALHDAGRYDDAIAKYLAVLADDPSNGSASYELAYSYQAKGDYAKCIAVLRPLSVAESVLLPRILASLGNCLDSSADAPGAVVAYRKSLALAPTDPSTLYNLGVTLFGQSKLDEARDVLKKELITRPGHANGHYLLARVFEAQNFRAAAILEYLRFLAIEPASPLSKGAASNLVALLNLGVEDKGMGKDGKMAIDVKVDPNSRTEEGDFHVWEMGISIASAGRFVSEDKNKNATELDIARDQLASSLRMLLEMNVAPNSYSGMQNIPFFATLEQHKILDTFAGAVLQSLDLKGSDAWMKKNAKGLQDVTAFMGGQH
jgi:tetratricopeptide (TPR) repeat protein